MYKKIETTSTDKTLEILGWTFLFAIWIWTIENYTNLPDTIPIHYDGTGQADGFGDKSKLLNLPFIATLLYIVITILNQFPHIFNYATPITSDNILKQYTNATRTLRVLKLIIVVIFGIITIQTIRRVNGEENGLGHWLLPLAIGLIFFPLLYFLIKSFTAKSK